MALRLFAVVFLVCDISLFYFETIPEKTIEQKGGKKSIEINEKGSEGEGTDEVFTQSRGFVKGAKTV